MRNCQFTDNRCKDCLQTALSNSALCYYHTKLKAGLVTRVDKYLSNVELDTLFGGRRRDDGRRLDHYTPKR